MRRWLSVVGIAASVLAGSYFAVRAVEAWLATPRLAIRTCITFDDDREVWEDPMPTSQIVAVGRHAYRRRYWQEDTRSWGAPKYSLNFRSARSYKVIPCPGAQEMN